MTLTHMMLFIIRIKKTMGNKHYHALVAAVVSAILLSPGCSGNKARADILSADSAAPQPTGAESGYVNQAAGITGNDITQPLSSAPMLSSQPPASSVSVPPAQLPASSAAVPPAQPPASEVNDVSPVPAGRPSNLFNVSAGASGMYSFYCFNGYIYQIVSDDSARILVYDKSDLSDQPIGSVYNPLYPDIKGDDVYGVNGIKNEAGASVPQSIAILFINSIVPTPDYYYQRADYFASDIVVYNGQAYQIAPISIVGILTSETESPYAVDKIIGETTDGYDIYSYKNPKSPGELAVDIPGMTCDLGDIRLYPMAIPIGSIRQSYSAMSFLNDKTGWLCETTLSPPNNAGPSPLSAKLLKTVDGGKSWTPVWIAPDAASAFTQLDFINDKTGWAIEAEGSGTACSLMETADSGKSWRKQLSGTPFLSFLQFFDASISPDEYGECDCDDVVFVSPRVGFAFSADYNYGSYIAGTTDGGETWNLISR